LHSASRLRRVVLLTAARAIINERSRIEHLQAAASRSVTYGELFLLLNTAGLMKFWAIAHSEPKQATNREVAEEITFLSRN
jgi:hypothetical protein